MKPTLYDPAEKKLQEIENGMSNNNVSVGQSNLSPISFVELQATIGKWLLIADAGLIKILAACVISNRLEAEPVWLLIVAGSGGSKTELLRGLNGLHDIYPISDLTPQTFLSGEKNNPKGSLLHRLPPEVIITMKDFTTVLEMSSEKRAIILSQLREIYDGDFRKEFGTGESKHWQGKMGFIAGVTTIIDRHQTVYQMLGERFIQYKPVQPDRLAVAKQAMANGGSEKQMREEIKNAFTGYIDGVDVSGKLAEVPEKYQEGLLNLAAFCTQARSGVVREAYSSHEIVFVPEPELPTRLVKQYSCLFKALALISGDYNEADYRLMYKIGMDSLPSLRRLIVEYLLAHDGLRSLKEISLVVNYPENSVRKQLEELRCLAIVAGNTLAMAFTYQLTEQTKTLLGKALPEPQLPEIDQLLNSAQSVSEISQGIVI